MILHETVNKLSCLIVDDEPPARDIIKRYVNDMPNLQLAGECGNAIQAISFLQQQEVDLLFLDIHMPQLSGIDLVKTLKHPPKVIFTTAHSEYAVEGYELDVVDYLLKPVQFERFIRSVNKVFQHNPPKENYEQPLPINQSGSGGFVYLRADRKMLKVLLSDIFYVESMKDYVKVFCRNGTVITRQSMMAIEAMLPASQFLRTHRSFIVSLDKIKSFTNDLIEIANTEIPVGKLYRPAVMKRLTQE